MGQITWFSKRWARLPGFAKIWARLPGEKIVFFLQKVDQITWRTRLPGRGPQWTRLPGRGQKWTRLPGQMFSCFFCCFAPLARGRQACRTRLPGRGTKWTRLPGRGQMGDRLPGVSTCFGCFAPCQNFVCSHRAAGDAALAGSAAPTGEPLELARARASGPSGGTVLCRAARVDGARRWWASCVRGAALGFCVVVC